MIRPEPLRFALAQAAPGVVGGFYVPFFPLWLAHQGLSPAETSMVLATGMFCRMMVSPLAGVIADALGDRRRVAMACAGVSTLGFAAMGFAAPLFGFAAILPLVMIAVPFNSATGPIVEGVTARAAIDYDFQYASVRVWGSLSYLAVNFAAGILIDWTGPGAIVWFIAAAVASCVLAFLPMPPLISDRRETRRAPGKALSRTWAETRVLARQPVFLLFLLTVALAQASHAAFYGFGTITFRGFGYSNDFIGFLWAFGTAAEVVLFAVSPWALRGASAVTLIGCGVALGLLRWIGMAFDTGPVAMAALQILHAGSFGLVHLGTMRFLGLAAPTRLTATSQSLFSVAVYGAGMGLTMLAIGQVYGQLGPRVYFLMAGMSAAALALCWPLARAWRGGNLFASIMKPGDIIR